MPPVTMSRKERYMASLAAAKGAAAPPPAKPAAPPEPSADAPPPASPPNSRRANYVRAKLAGTLGQPAASAAHVPDDGSGSVPAKNWFGKPKPGQAPVPPKKPEAAAGPLTDSLYRSYARELFDIINDTQSAAGELQARLAKVQKFAAVQQQLDPQFKSLMGKAISVVKQRAVQDRQSYDQNYGASVSAAGTQKQMNHSTYQQSLKNKTPAELQYIIKDAREAIQAMPQGPNAGYYQDEIHYAAAELKKRKGAGASASAAIAPTGKRVSIQFPDQNAANVFVKSAERFDSVTVAEARNGKVLLLVDPGDTAAIAALKQAALAGGAKSVPLAQGAVSAAAPFTLKIPFADSGLAAKMIQKAKAAGIKVESMVGPDSKGGKIYYVTLIGDKEVIRKLRGPGASTVSAAGTCHHCGK